MRIYRGFVILLVPLLAGCGHLHFNTVKEHEEGHCTEFGVIDKSQWHYVYASGEETRRVCREKTGLIFVAACAQRIGTQCYIYLPESER